DRRVDQPILRPLLAVDHHVKVADVVGGATDVRGPAGFADAQFRDLLVRRAVLAVQDNAPLGWFAAGLRDVPDVLPVAAERYLVRRRVRDARVTGVLIDDHETLGTLLGRVRKPMTDRVKLGLDDAIEYRAYLVVDDHHR